MRSIADLTEEAEALWKAEGGKSGVSAGWGCVALITPEAFLNNPDGDNRQMLLDAWQKHISGVHSYGRFQFSQNDEKFVGKGKKVIEGGRLKIPWPTPSDGRPLDLDLILATVTKPEIDKRKDYPSTETIARAWNKNDHVYYFWCNRWAGIQTADDDAIEKLLHRRNVRSPRSHRDGLTFR